MKNKRFTAKILIDIGMTICLLLLMPYSLLSETAHEWIGMVMLVLFISHHILNHKWVTSVRKGKYNAFRVIQTVLVIIMLILIMGSMISGILLSNHIFKWIKISGTYMTARQIHMFCAYWGLVVMSLHLGFHWNIAVAMVGRLWEHPSVIRTWAARSVATTIAGYGLYAFYRRQIGDYLIMRMHFVFYDYEKGIFPFLLDYLAVMILIAFIGYYCLHPPGRTQPQRQYPCAYRYQFSADRGSSVPALHGQTGRHPRRVQTPLHRRGDGILQSRSHGAVPPGKSLSNRPFAWQQKPHYRA